MAHSNRLISGMQMPVNGVNNIIYMIQLSRNDLHKEYYVLSLARHRDGKTLAFGHLL